MASPPDNRLQSLLWRAGCCAVLWLAQAGAASANVEPLPSVNDSAPILQAPQATLANEPPTDASAPASGSLFSSAAPNEAPPSESLFAGLLDTLKGQRNDDADAVVLTAGPQAYADVAEDEDWSWQLLPGSLIYHSYLAGAKEPRLGSFFAYDKYHGWMWDITLGGRVGLLRYGSQGGLRPQGWQFDLEGAAFPRLDLMSNEDLMAADFRAGAPLTYGRGNYQAKFAMYHLSSHAGDEFMLSNPGFVRINYSRNVLVWGHSYYWNNWRIYGEVGWAFDTEIGGPWEFQTGLEYSPLCASAPFMALNLHSREEVDFGGNVVLQAGWQWRAASRLFRIGFEYYDGKSDQFEFYSQTEQKVGVGFWYDF